MPITQVQPTVALPVTGKVIVLDPGHGGRDPGAVGITGTLEKDINLDIALKLQGLLEQAGCVTQLTRAVDESIHEEGTYNFKRSDLNNRKKIIDDSKADALISIHLNSFPNPKYKGVQSFYSKNCEDCKSMAVSVQTELKKILRINDNREALPIKDVYLMKNVNIPAIIVECGFLSNPEEEALLKTDEYRKKIAWGIFVGMMKYFEE